MAAFDALLGGRPKIWSGFDQTQTRIKFGQVIRIGGDNDRVATFSGTYNNGGIDQVGGTGLATQDASGLGGQLVHSHNLDQI